MSRPSVRRPAAVVLATLTASAVLGVAPASAKPVISDTVEDSFTFLDDDFCGAGRTVLVEGSTTTRFAVHVKKGLPYFRGVTQGEVTFTNPQTGASVTENWNTLERDMAVTLNGDGTYTVLVMATGNSTVTDSSGKAIARNPGQLRFEILISDEGTPDDFADDEFLQFLQVVRESTGRNDDFCEAVVPALG